MYAYLIQPKRAVIALSLFAASFSFACEKEAAVAPEEFETTQLASSALDRDARDSSRGHGMFGCFEPIFPITLQLADSSLVEIASREEMQTKRKELRGESKDRGSRPKLVFPIDVRSQADSTVSVGSRLV